MPHQEWLRAAGVTRVSLGAQSFDERQLKLLGRIHSADDVDKVKNIVVYGDENGGAKPLVENLTADNVSVTYSQFALNKGTVTVSVTNYQFQFVIPIVGTTIQMPNYTTTLTGESVGFVPANL